MRFNLLARRIMVPALGLALAAAVGACSSSSSSAAASGSGSPAVSSGSPVPAGSGSPSAPAASAPAGGSSSAAVATITANWEAFFSGKTDAAKKISLLENGQKFATVIKAQAGSGLASLVSAKVTAVVVNSASSATVSYNIVSGGQTLLGNQTGTAVYQDGIWKVGDVSFCQLLKLQGSGGSVC